MRRSRQRKKIINIRQSGGWNNTRASPVPSYESFTIPTPRGFPSKEAPGNNIMDMSLTGRKRPASDAEHAQESTSSGALLQPAPLERGDSEGDFACQHSLDGCVGSGRPLPQTTKTGVKQIVVRLCGLRQSAAISGESLSVNHGEPVKDIGTGTESQQETHRAVWSNFTDCSENRQMNHYMNCSHADFQSSQHVGVKPTIRILHQALQIPEKREPKEEPAETQEEDRPGPPVNGENSGTSMGKLAPIDERRSVPESRDEQARSGVGHDLPARSAGCGFPHPANPSWMPNANVCRSCPGTTIFPTNNNQAASGCTASGATRFPAPCSFQRGVPRAVRYYVEPASLNEIKCFPRRIEAPACCQRMDFEGAQPPVMYAQTMKPGDPHAVRARNLVVPLRTSEGHHTCGSHHYISGDDVLVCPAPWVHKGRIFPGVPAMCVDQQKYESMGVNWAQPESEGQAKANEKPEESSLREMPDPVFPPAHCNNHTTPSFTADLDMDTQRQLEEQIAHEILLLSQKLANLQARYGARRLVHDNTKPAVLSCPQTPLLLDNPTTSQRDVKCNARAPSMSMNEDTSQQQQQQQLRPTTSSSSRSTHNKQPDSRSQLEERKPGGRHNGTNKGASSITSSRRGSDSGTTTVASNKNHPNSRASFGSQTSGNSTRTDSRAVEATLVQRWGKVLRETMNQAGKPGNNNQPRTFSSTYRKGRERELVDECSYSDDMKEHLRTGKAHVQGYPDGKKRFDWVKSLRFGGISVRENQGCADFTSQMDSKQSSPRKEFTDVDAETWLRDTSHEHERFVTITPTLMSKSVQAGGISPEAPAVASCAGTPAHLDERHDRPESRPKRRPDSSIENRFGKPGKRPGSPDEMGGLDSKLAHHLVKAGLRRAPSFWRVPGIRPVPNANLKLKKKIFGSRSPRKDGGKRLRRRTLFNPMSSDPSDVPPEAKPGERKENASQQCELKVEQQTRESDVEATDAQWQKEVGDYEAEYETFVENTNVGLHHNNLDSEEYTSVVNREALTSLPTSEADHGLKRSPSSCMKARLSEVPVVSLTKQPPPATKKTFIRCIELVIATKTKNHLPKLNGRNKAPGIGFNSHRRVVLDCLERPSKDHVYGMDQGYHSRAHVIEAPGAACQDHPPVAEEQTVWKPKQSPESSSSRESSAMALVEKQGIRNAEVFEENSFVKSMTQADDGCIIASQKHLEHNKGRTSPNELHKAADPDPDCHPSVRIVDQVSKLASILSRVMPKQMESMEPTHLRARWEEIFDALEKERLGLPKIKIGGRKTGVTTRTNSPRDSGGVKRIAEQLKSSTLRATTTTKLDKAKEKDALEDAAMPKGRPHWSKIQQQKQAVVF